MLHAPDSTWLWGWWLVAKEEPQLLAQFTGWWNISIQGRPPSFCLLLWSFQRMTSPVQMNLPNTLNENLFFKKSTLISKGFTFWTCLDELERQFCISQDRRMHSLHQRRDPPVLSIPHLCLRAHQANTHNWKIHPTTILETHIRNNGSPKPTPTYIKTHLRTQETP